MISEQVTKTTCGSDGFGRLARTPAHALRGKSAGTGASACSISCRDDTPGIATACDLRWALANLPPTSWTAWRRRVDERIATDPFPATAEQIRRFEREKAEERALVALAVRILRGAAP
jgi:hypothetical protein